MHYGHVMGVGSALRVPSQILWLQFFKVLDFMGESLFFYVHVYVYLFVTSSKAKFGVVHFDSFPVQCSDEDRDSRMEVIMLIIIVLIIFGLMKTYSWKIEFRSEPLHGHLMVSWWVAGSEH